ncbi:hypothetical protein AX16_004648 [Volvariella volvacea WC 439]|nr:hypothetical protein AX16_004648 [Volvariella volvacea WC 439]
MPARDRTRGVSDDPLDEVLRPPPNESPGEREIRLAREEEARKISQAIDASIKAEKQARKKKRIVRLLLLGQSESGTVLSFFPPSHFSFPPTGKSTTLRQFQRLYTPTAFREERILWRAVIQLNIVRSIRTILDALNSLPTSQTPSTSPMSSPRSRARSIPRQSQPPVPPLPSTLSDIPDGDRDSITSGSPPRVQPPLSHRSSHSPHRTPSETDPDSDSDPHPPSIPSSTTLTSPLEALKTRLAPIRHIEQLLIAKLVPPNEDEATHLAGPSHSQHPSGSNYRNQEIFVRPTTSWKGALSKARVNYPSNAFSSNGSGSGSSSGDDRSNGRPNSAGNTGLETPDEAQEVLHACRRDMMLLWRDEGVKEVLKRKKIRLEESSGFFLNDLERVTSMKYMPTDDDVLKARLKTVGVSEYKFEMEVNAGRDAGTEWRIVDVGGSRSQVPTWVPFFDDVDAIIFLAPISGFDQVLSEDRTVNRLEDSVLLWKAVCSNKLLANVDLVLFLNKCDILDAKLKSGVQLAKYVRSYGDRENDLDTVSKYLRSKFSAIHREYSPNPRKFYAFCTSVTDTTTTAGIIASVRDMVIRQHLKQSKLL